MCVCILQFNFHFASPLPVSLSLSFAQPIMLSSAQARQAMSGVVKSQHEAHNESEKSLLIENNLKLFFGARERSRAIV